MLHFGNTPTSKNHSDGRSPAPSTAMPLQASSGRPWKAAGSVYPSSRTASCPWNPPACSPIFFIPHLTVRVLQGGAGTATPPHHHCTGSPLTRLNQVSRAKQLLSSLPVSWGCLLHLTLRGAPRHECRTDISKCSIFSRITPACLSVGFLSTRQE